MMRKLSSSSTYAVLFTWSSWQHQPIQTGKISPLPSPNNKKCDTQNISRSTVNTFVFEGEGSCVAGDSTTEHNQAIGPKKLIITLPLFCLALSCDPSLMRAPFVSLQKNIRNWSSNDGSFKGIRNRMSNTNCKC